jgi:hypothetical protein
MVQVPKRNLSTTISLSSTEVSPLVEMPTGMSQKKPIKSCRQEQAKCVVAVPTPATVQLDPIDGRKPWGRSRSFDEPTERIPIALPITLTQALRLKAVMVKRTPSQIIAELLRVHL